MEGLDLLYNNRRHDHHSHKFSDYRDQKQQSTLTMFSRHVFCGDYIFSGHTMTLVILALHLHHVVVVTIIDYDALKGRILLSFF